MEFCSNTEPPGIIMPSWIIHIYLPQGWWTPVATHRTHFRPAPCSSSAQLPSLPACQWASLSTWARQLSPAPMSTLPWPNKLNGHPSVSSATGAAGGPTWCHLLESIDPEELCPGYDWPLWKQSHLETLRLDWNSARRLNHFLVEIVSRLNYLWTTRLGCRAWSEALSGSSYT